MSERSEITISAKFLFLVLTLGCIGGLFIGAYLGALRGRAEQKKWDDSYYVAHPVVKEVPKHRMLSCVEMVAKYPELEATCGTDGFILLPAKTVTVKRPIEFSEPCECAPTPPAQPAKASKPVKPKEEIKHDSGTIHLPASTWYKCADGSVANYPCANPAPCVTPSNGPQDVEPPSYLEVNDCSWHHGRNPREVPRP